MQKHDFSKRVPSRCHLMRGDNTCVNPYRERGKKPICDCPDPRTCIDLKVYEEKERFRRYSAEQRIGMGQGDIF